MTQTSPHKLRVGIIGFGRRGVLHAALANMNPEVKVTGVFDPDTVLLDHMNKLGFGNCFFDDLDRMFETARPDVVFICTPNDSHHTSAQKSREHKAHIFVERPLADSLTAAREMMRLTVGNTFIHSVGYYFPFQAVYSEAKSLLDQRILGETKRIRASLYHSLLTRKREGWLYQKEKSGGGIVTNTASSLLFLLLWYFGPVKTVYAKTTHKHAEVEDGASIILEFETGVIGYADVSWSHPGHPCPTTKVRIEGTQGVMEISDDILKFHLYRSAQGFGKGWTSKHISDLASPGEFYLGGEGYYEANTHFIHSCRTNEKPIVTWNDGYEVMRLTDAVYLSSRTNNVIHLNEVK